MSTGKPKETTNGDVKNQSTHHISVILFQSHFRTLINLAMTGFCSGMVGYPQLRKQFFIKLRKCHDSLFHDNGQCNHIYSGYCALPADPSSCAV